MPQVFYKCNNFVNCQNYIEKPGLCRDCKEEARKLTEQVEKENKLEGFYVPKKNRRRNHWRVQS